MTLRYYANAPATTLASSCTSGATTIEVTAVTGLPIQYPFTLIIERGLSTEEVVEVSSASGTTLTVVRGADSTTAFAHPTASEVVHGISARDPREANVHVNATSAVHGVTGALVGATDTQSLTNKTLGSSNTINGFTASRFMQSDGTGKLGSSTKAIPTGDVLGTTDTQTVTGKTISTDSNTINGLPLSSFAVSDGSGKLDGSAAVKAIPTGVVLGDADTQTVTNKDLSSATNTFPTGLVDTGWTAISAATGWTQPGTSPIQIRKIGNHVFLRGAITKNSGDVAVSDTPLATIDAAYRPANTVVMRAIGAGVGQDYLFSITSGGVLTVTGASGSSSTFRVNSLDYWTD